MKLHDIIGKINATITLCDAAGATIFDSIESYSDKLKPYYNFKLEELVPLDIDRLYISIARSYTCTLRHGDIMSFDDATSLFIYLLMNYNKVIEMSIGNEVLKLDELVQLFVNEIKLNRNEESANKIKELILKYYNDKMLGKRK